MTDLTRILVVDDDPGIARLIAASLEDEGYTVDVLTDGRKLVERAQELAPDVILLDAVMPFVGLEEHLRQLHEEPATRHIPVLLVTADSRTRADIERWREFGVVDSVPKPFDLDLLSGKVESVLRRD